MSAVARRMPGCRSTCGARAGSSSIQPTARLLARHADFLGEATCRGRLVLVKHYPGLLLSDVPSDRVHGELFQLRVPAELLRELDMYEACGEGFPEPTEYLRQLVDVT